LPLLKTLREIYLENAPIEWMSGYVFMNLATLSVAISYGVYEARSQEFHFNAGRNTFPCLCTIRLLHRRLEYSPRNWGQQKLDQLLHMIWGPAEVRKTEHKEGDYHVFCAEALLS